MTEKKDRSGTGNKHQPKSTFVKKNRNSDFAEQNSGKDIQGITLDSAPPKSPPKKGIKK